MAKHGQRPDLMNYRGAHLIPHLFSAEVSQQLTHMIILAKFLNSAISGINEINAAFFIS